MIASHTEYCHWAWGIKIVNRDSDLNNEFYRYRICKYIFYINVNFGEKNY